MDLRSAEWSHRELKPDDTPASPILAGLILVVLIPFGATVLIRPEEGTNASLLVVNLVLRFWLMPAGLAVLFFAMLIWLMFRSQITNRSSFGMRKYYATKFFLYACNFFLFVTTTSLWVWWQFGATLWFAGFQALLLSAVGYVVRKRNRLIGYFHQTRKFRTGLDSDGAIPAMAGPLLLTFGKACADIVGRSTVVEIFVPIVFAAVAYASIHAVEVIVLSLYRARLHWMMPEGIVAEPLPPLPQKKNG